MQRTFPFGGSKVTALLVAGVVLTLAYPALADGGGSSNTTPSCPTGQIYDKNEKKCVPEESSNLDQDSIFETGRALAYSGKYDDAIRVLRLAKNQADPRVQNMLGYSHRKSGNMELALVHYQSAVDANPNYSLVREYLGEAYLQLGMLEKAREQLSEIERICHGKACDEYQELAKLIVDSQTQ